MIRKVIFTVFFISVLAATGYAAGKDNGASLPGESKPSPAGGPSYFEGVWVGKWPHFRSSNLDQDISITIEKGKMAGFFGVTYSWGAVNYPTGTAAPGSLQTKGREEGDKFFFKWKNPQGREFEVTLQKHKDDVAKARIDRSGPLGTGETPYTESHLNRK